MRYEIRIIDNGAERALDLVESSFPYNFEANDIAELADRSASWSYSITLPRTANNETIFDHAGSPFVNSQAPYKRFLCNVYARGLLIIDNGVLFLDSATKTQYKVQIISGVADIFERMKDALLDSERWSEYAITLPNDTWKKTDTMVHYHQSCEVDVNGTIHNNTKAGDFYWYASPVVQVGGTGGLLDFILQRVLNGYTLVTNNTPQRSMCLSLAKRKRFEPQDYVYKSGKYVLPHTSLENKTQEYSITTKRSQYTKSVLEFEYKPSTRNNNNISALRAAQLFFNSGSDGGYLMIQFINQSTDEVIKAFAIIKPGSGMIIPDHTLIEWNGQLPIKVNLDIENSDAYSSIKVIYGFSDTRWYDGASGKYYVGLPTEAHDADITTRGEIYLQETHYPKNNKDGYAYPGQKILPLACLGYNTALDVFKMLCQFYGWIVTVNAKTKTIYAYSFGYIKGRKSEAVDWSDKVVIADAESKFTFGKYAQNNIISYAENAHTGLIISDKFTIPNLNLESEAKIMDIKISSGNRYNRIEQWENKEDGAVEWKDGSNPHLVSYSSDHVYHYAIDNVLNAYSPLADSMQSTLVLRIPILLSSIDIIQFDIYKPVYLRQYGAYFYVNKISGWEDGKLCEVELLKL